MTGDAQRYARVTIITWDDENNPMAVIDFPRAMGSLSEGAEPTVPDLIAPVTIGSPMLERVTASVIGVPRRADDPRPYLEPEDLVRFLLPQDEVADSAKGFVEALDAKIEGQVD